MKKSSSVLILLSLLHTTFAAEPRSIDIPSYTPPSSVNNYTPANSARLNTMRFGLEYGRIVSKFAYKNSAGEPLENLYGGTDDHLAIQGKFPIKKSNIYFLSSLEQNTYAARGSDNLVGNYYDWSVKYLGINVGIGYEFTDFDFYYYRLKANRSPVLSLFGQATVGPEFLIQGSQTINNQVYDLRGAEEFDRPFLFARGGLGTVYYASDVFSVYLQYMGGMGFPVFKAESASDEDLKYITHTISLGVQINLPPY